MATYASVDELKIRIQIQRETLTVDQASVLTAILEAASRNIDDLCRRQANGFLADAVASEKYFTSKGESFLRIPECVEITEVAVKESLTATTYTAWTTPTTPMAGDGDWIPCTGSSDDPVFSELPYDLILIDPNGSYGKFLNGGAAPVIKITARWGPETLVPPQIREACLMQSARWYKEYQGAMDGSLSSDELGRILYRKGLSSSVQQILFDGGWVIPLYGGSR